MSVARTAVFGGTFDPIHNAHLEIARAAADRFQLNKVLFVPAANPPHKPAGPHASYEDRVRMAELACEGEPRFEVSRIEQGPRRNYSIVTVEKLLAAGLGPLAFLIGADAFAEIQTWHRWRDLVRAVEFIVVTRPGAAYAVPPGAAVRELAGIERSEASSEIRLKLASGDPGVPVPPPVLRYIRERRLYRSQTAQ